MKKLIIFDMDGTLIDSSLTLANAINYVRNQLGLKAMDEQLILKSINEPTIKPAEFFYNADSFTPQHEEWFSHYYTQNHEQEIQLYEGIRNLLVILKLEGYKLAIATNAYRVSAIQSLNHLKLVKQFDVVICADDVPNGKPHPDMLYSILKTLNLTTEDALFIGDGERDQLSAKASNIDYLMVNWGFSDYSNAIHTVEQLQQSILEF
ncbi:MAG TPA: HAD family hydrolase [Campylobacterales bacterium]|nr:HAD family hydrolase [Campylobacterales bacterium]